MPIHRASSAGTPGITAAGGPAGRRRLRAAGGGGALRRGIALGLTAGLVSVAVSACGSSSVKPTAATASVVSAPVRVAHTRLGAVGYRMVGSGPPLILIMGYGWAMEDWDPPRGS